MSESEREFLITEENDSETHNENDGNRNENENEIGERKIAVKDFIHQVLQEFGQDDKTLHDLHSLLKLFYNENMPIEMVMDKLDLLFSKSNHKSQLLGSFISNLSHDKQSIANKYLEEEKIRKKDSADQGTDPSTDPSTDLDSPLKDDENIEASFHSRNGRPK